MRGETERSPRAGTVRLGQVGTMLLTHQHFTDRPPRVLTAADAVLVLGNALNTAEREHLRIAHLDREGSLIALTEQPGGCDALSLALDRIARDALLRESHRLLIAHNHPSGDPAPSKADRTATRRLAELLRMLGIELVDHLIFARGGVTSFRQLGLL
jgi:DNA repair protein RadC